MKINITKILFLAALMTLCTAANAQTYTSFGIGVVVPKGTLHVHNATPSDPVLPADPNPRNSPLFDNNYSTVIRLTNPNSDSTATDGATLSQHNWDIELRNLERGYVSLRTPGGYVYLSETGRFGIGDTSASHIFNVEGTSRLNGNTAVNGTLTVTGSTTLANMQATGSVLAGTLSVGTGFSVSAIGNVVVNRSVTVGDIQLTPNGGLHSVNGNFSLTENGNFQTLGNMTVGGNIVSTGSLRVGDGFYCDAHGNAKVKELRVTLTDWPDYVFGEGYRLMPLGEVEDYVTENGHLPQMPSAAEVEQEGADLGQMNKLLLQKVEEPTLYVIDLQKQLDELKSNKQNQHKL